MCLVSSGLNATESSGRLPVTVTRYIVRFCVNFLVINVFESTTTRRSHGRVVLDRKTQWHARIQKHQRNLHGTIDALSRAQRADPRWTLCCAQATRFQLFSGESKTKVKTGEQKQRSSRRSFLHYRPGQRPIFANRNRIGIHGRRSYFSGPFPGINVTQWQRCVIAKHALTLERSQLGIFSSAPPLLCNTSPTTGWLFN